MAISDVLTGFNAGAARVALTGAVRTAPLGTPIKSITEKYTEEFTNLGYLSPDGVEISFDEDKQEYIPWQEVSAIRTDITKAAKSIKFTLWETDPEKIAMFLGVPANQVSKITGEDGAVAFWEEGLPNFELQQLHVDMVDGDKHNRVSFPAAKITERGALVMKKDDIFGLEVTFTTFPAGAEYEGTTARGKTAYWQFNSAFAQAADVSTAVDGVAALRVTTMSLPDGTQNEAYSATLSATGGTPAYTWAVSEGTLPDGIELEADGTLSGTVGASAVTQDVTFKVTDSKGLPASKQLTITIS